MELVKNQLNNKFIEENRMIYIYIIYKITDSKRFTNMQVLLYLQFNTNKKIFLIESAYVKCKVTRKFVLFNR